MATAGDEKAIGDAAAQGARLAAAWHGGVGSLIDFCVGIRNGFAAFEKTKPLLDAFLAPLVAQGALTANEARLGRSGSKLSMLIQIGENKQLLSRNEIARHLMAGYTLLYQAVVIFRNLPGEEAQKVEELIRILAACPDDGAREYLLATTRRLKREQSAAKAAQEASAQDAGEPPATTTLRELIAAHQRFDLLVLTPGQELRLLGEDYPDDLTREESVLEHSLPIHTVVNDDAAIMIAAKVRDLALIENRLLDLCGFARPLDVLLTKKPASSTIIGSDIMIVAKRGKTRLNLPANAWIDEERALKPMEIAAQLCPDAARRLHLFASTHAPGWCCVPSDDTWLERPSVR